MSSWGARPTAKYVVLTVLSGLLLTSVAGEAGILDASWTAPTTNTDGSPLTDLASYRVYYATSGSPCPSSAFVHVSSPTTTPGPNQVISQRLSGLATGITYNVSVSALDANGNQSSCSGVTSAVARSDVAVSPSGTVSFGTVNIGSFVEKVLTISNTGGGNISGSASVPAPFTIRSGSPFTLNGVGATQAVTVRFTPVSSATASTNVTFTAGGGTLSATVTGTGGGVASGTASVTVTPSPSATLGVTPASVAARSPVTATWRGIAAPTSTDWIGLYAAGAGDGVYLAWLYVSCARTPGAAQAAGSCPLQIPGSVPPGAYELRLFAADGFTRLATSGTFTVTYANTTSPSAAVTEPTVISGVTMSNITSSGVRINWTTNNASDSQVEYGRQRRHYRNRTGLDGTLVASHAQVLSGLASDTWYHFRVRSRDASGKLAVSGDFWFRTK